ncbi:MAG: PPC domain-containing protein [Gammaproteobacteria bacterium]|nr:PPC domain-containing protein [Gammaproteobacteria bacterium]
MKSLLPAAIAAVGMVAGTAGGDGEDDHGDDHGDTYLSSTRLTYGVTTEAELGADDTDVFRIDLQGRAEIDVRGSGRLDTVGALLDSEGVVLAEDDDSGAGFNFRFQETLDGGVYYVRVSSDMGDTGVHKITAYIVRADDNGDTSGNSTVLPLGVRATARIDTAMDRDVFRVEVAEAGQLRIATEGPTNTMGELRDSTDVVLESADGGGDRGNFSIVHSVAPGVYYMHVTADAVGTYFALAEMGEFEDVDEEHHAEDDDHEAEPAESAATTFFRESISTPIVQGRCINCHVQGGVAPNGGAHLVFVRATDADHIEKNVSAFRDFLDHHENAAYVLTKVTGGAGHGGGAQLTTGSTDYQNLASFLALLEDEG